MTSQVISQKNFDKRLLSSTGIFMDWKLQTESEIKIKECCEVFWDDIQGRIQRFWKGGRTNVGLRSSPRKNILGFRWSEKAKITLET